MDDDSLDEFEDQTPGPDAHPPLSAAALARDAGSEGSEDDDGVEMTADAQGRLEASGALNSDDDSESCPICLNTFRGQVVGTPQSCAHYFCLDCIVEWSKNANSCPVDRTVFKCICIRACYGGKILKKIPVQSARAAEDEDEDEDPTFCEVCGHSDREDRLLLCDGCDAGYHMECLEPPLREVPVDEWFCPECAPSTAAATATDAGLVSEEEVSLLLADTVPTSSRLWPHTGRTRAIARTRQSERVRATVNRNRMSTASRVQRIPQYLTSSLLDETIEAVVSGLSTAVYQRPTTPWAPTKRRRKGRRRRAAGRKKVQRRPPPRSKGSGTRSRRRQGRAKKRKGRTPKNEVTARCRIARTLGLRRPVRGACIPSVYKPADPSLGLLRADIGAASLSLFGDPYELDPFDSSEEPAANPASPLSTKRRVLSRSALRSHQPVARPVPMGLSRRSVPAVAPEPEMDAAPASDLLGSILSGQSLLLMDSADVTIHRDGSLSAKRAVPASFQRNSAGPCAEGDSPGPGDGLRPRAPHSGCSGGLGSRCQGKPAPSCIPALSGGAAVRPDSSGAPRSSQAQSASNATSPSSKQHDSPQFNGDSKQALPLRFASKTSNGNLPSKSAGLGQATRPAPRRTDISELPRIPKIRRDDGGSRREGPAPAPAPAGGQQVSIPSSCISRLTGREGPGQPGLGTRADGEPRGRASQEPGVHSGSGTQPPGPLGPSRAKGSGTGFQSFRINIPGSAAHTSRLPPPGFCDTFRPVDNKAPRKDSASSLFSLRKTKQLESEIYDPFDPTGSDSSSASSPERLGSGLLPSEITRTISVDSPRAAPLPAVRRVTSYTVEAGSSEEPGPPHGPSLDVLKLPDEEGPPEGRGPAARAQRPSPPGPWEDEDPPLHSSFFSAEERTVTCVTGTEPDVPPPAPPTHRAVELQAQPRSRSRSRSTSSSRGRKEARRKRAPAREPRRTRSGTRSGSRSGDGSSGSVSPPVGEDNARRQQPKARSRRSSSECSSSHERARRKKAKDKGRERSRGFRGPGRRRSRSRSGSPGGSSHEHQDSRRRRRRRSGSRPRGRGCSPPSSLDRAWRPRHPRERSRERPRDRRGSRERRKHRSRSPRSSSAEHRPREHRRPRSREHRPRPRPPEREPPAKGASPAVPPPEGPQPHSESPAPLLAWAGAGALAEGTKAEALPRASAVPEVSAGCPPEDLDYGDSVEAGHVFEDFSGEGIFMQLDDMSSPPSPESTDSSPERAFPPNPAAPAAGQHQDTGPAVAVIRREASPVHGEDAAQPLPWAEGPQGLLLFQRGPARAAVVPGTPGGLAVGQEEGPPQTPALRAKAPVKRVTWNLQEAAGGALAEDRGPRMPLHRPQPPQEEAWETEDKGPVAAPQQAPLPEPPPHGHLLPEPGFPDADAIQVYNPSLPSAPALPLSIPPYAPVSQPTVQFILQGSLPLAGCGVAQSPAPVPTILTTASEPAGHATATNNSEERTATPRPAAEKTKNEEYMKKLHVQERAVEEVKLAIKPFYQRREVTKDEYKDILRKAVQKICHSKSGEINPVKVGNLVKAYVDKYRHMRRHRRPEAGEEPPAQGAEG
ncbi:PHD and RING finger domain-containing protein 1 isoform X5 [Rousettus aegyptiacus]|uniref:PHD and RING finger domain-containing protein 1 isoform X5 n=1 Tax=Rousettus aegyptiacus TaxID=9407 RepID=UPI00168D12D3|nr:PHD and RING finger domain-containing protein 1 isoform X5 [Rousettus aegyptiacus]